MWDVMQSCNRSKSCVVLLCVLVGVSVVFSGFGYASPDDDCLISAVFDVVFVSETVLRVDVDVVPYLISIDKEYSQSDIAGASSEEIGAIKYAVFLMLEEQLEMIFGDGIISDFSLPEYESGHFFGVVDVELSAGFFGFDSGVNAQEVVGGLLAVGGLCNYSFVFSALAGWNNTFNVVLPTDIVFDTVNTVEVSESGKILTWRVLNWENTAVPEIASLVLKKAEASFLAESEDIRVAFVVDSEQPAMVGLEVELSCFSLANVYTDRIPVVFSNIDFLPADVLRVLFNNSIISWGLVFNRSVESVVVAVQSVIANTYFNSSYAPEFIWDSATTHASFDGLALSDFDDEPAVRAFLIQESLPFSLFGLPLRAVYGLVNIGGVAQVTPSDLNFGEMVNSFSYEYNFSLQFPDGIFLDNQNPFRWNSTNDFTGNVTSLLAPSYGNDSVQVEEQVSFDISKMDLNIFSIFSGKLSLTSTTSLSSDTAFYVSSIPSSFDIPDAIQLEYLNADGFRLCVEEQVFTQEMIDAYFDKQKEQYIHNYQNITSIGDVDPHIVEYVFFDSLQWDGDIASMDASSPIHTQISSTNLHPLNMNISIIPPGLDIQNQTFILKNDPVKTINYQICYPKGIEIHVTSDTGDSLTVDETEDGRQYITVTLPPSSQPTDYSLSCHLTASPLFIISIFLPLILSLLLVIILIIIVLWLRRRGKNLISRRKHQPDQTNYQDEEYYIQPPKKK